MLYLYPKGSIMDKQENTKVANFVRYHRKTLNLTQDDLSKKAGVGLRFIRDLEQGKETLRLDKVNQVLELFGQQLSPSTMKTIDPYEIMLNHMRVDVEIALKNKTSVTGQILDPHLKNGEIKSWKFLSQNHKADYRKGKSELLIRYIDNDEIETLNNLSR